MKYLKLPVTGGCFIAWFILGFPFYDDWWIAFAVCFTVDVFRGLKNKND